MQVSGTIFNRCQLSKGHLSKKHMSWWHLSISAISQVLMRTYCLILLRFEKLGTYCLTWQIIPDAKQSIGSNLERVKIRSYKYYYLSNRTWLYCSAWLRLKLKLAYTIFLLLIPHFHHHKPFHQLQLWKRHNKLNVVYP